MGTAGQRSGADHRCARAGVDETAFEDVVVATLESTPPADATHGSRAKMAQRSGLSKSTIGRIWKEVSLAPLSSRHRLRGDLHLERRAVQSFLGRQVDGLVIIPCHEIGSADSVALAAASTVTIQFDRRVPSIDAHFIGCDNRHGMTLVRQHVDRAVDVQRQPVVYLGAQSVSSSAHERLDGFTKRFPGSRRLLGSFSFQWGQQAATQLLDEGVRSGSLVTAADVIAVGAMTTLQSRGFRIPQDFRVVGFDGIGVSSLAHPSLTTVRQPVEAMTRAIFDLVFASLNDALEIGWRSVRLKPEFVLGRSSPASAPRADVSVGRVDSFRRMPAPG